MCHVEIIMKQQKVKQVLKLEIRDYLLITRKGKNMKIRKAVILIVCFVMVLSFNTVSFAAPGTDAAADLKSDMAPDFISFSQYIEKYGRENVINGLKKAEAVNNVKVLGKSAEKDLINMPNSILSQAPNDLFLSLSEGNFLGFEILGISDLPPDNERLSVRLKDERVSSNTSFSPINDNRAANIASANNIKHYTNYDVYYSDNMPGTADLNQAYEPLHGSYIYKYSYAFDNNYLCSTDITFNGTEIKNGNQENVVYAYVAAKSSAQTLDFGLMGNPSDSLRGDGLYAFFNNGRGIFEAELHPKVASIQDLGTNHIKLEDKTVRMRLSIGTGTAELYMGVGGNSIYYKILDEDYDVDSLISGQTGIGLTFIQAMSSLARSEGINTSPTSGSFFKNVKFSNSLLYNYDDTVRNFNTYGPDTYYLFACKPSKIDFSYGSNSETVSINYN